MKRMMYLLLMTIGLNSQLSAMEYQQNELSLPADVDSSKQQEELDELLAQIGQQQEKTGRAIDETLKKIKEIKEPAPISQICKGAKIENAAIGAYTASSLIYLGIRIGYELPYKGRMSESARDIALLITALGGVQAVAKMTLPFPLKDIACVGISLPITYLNIQGSRSWLPHHFKG